MDNLLIDEAMSEREKVILTDDYVSRHAVEIGQVLKKAVNEALLRHQRLGNSVAIWRDGKVVTITPEEIVIPPDASEAES